MFNCAECKQPAEPRTRPHRIITEKREQTYNNHGRISRGWEIVKEVNLCTDCYESQPIKEVYNETNK